MPDLQAGIFLAGAILHVVVNMSGRNNRKWENFKQKHAEKRRKKEEKLPDSVEYLTVQRLTAEVEGKCQKYGRIGPLSIVPFTHESLTLENIKSACKKHFDIGSYSATFLQAKEALHIQA